LASFHCPRSKILNICTWSRALVAAAALFMHTLQLLLCLCLPSTLLFLLLALTPHLHLTDSR
jgi:hypothetical protein